MENNNTQRTKNSKVEYTTSWVGRILLGSLVAVGTVATAFNIYTYFKEGDGNTSSSNTVSE